MANWRFNAEFQLVDERLVGRKPAALPAADAAALPLTGITAWELLFARLQVPLAGHGRPSTLFMVAQHRLLDALADLVDEGAVRSTAQVHLGSINAANLRRAHALAESGTALGKIVLEGFGAEGD